MTLFVPWKDYKVVTADLKLIYDANTEKLALKELNAYEQQWGEQYPPIVKSWRDNWENVATLFQYPPDIRRAIYTFIPRLVNYLNSINRKKKFRRSKKGTNSVRTCLVE